MTSFLKSIIALLFTSLSFYSASATKHHVYVGQGSNECFSLTPPTFDGAVGDTVVVHWVSGTHEIYAPSSSAPYGTLSASNPIINYIITCEDGQLGSSSLYCADHSASTEFMTHTLSQPGAVTITGPDTITLCLDGGLYAYGTLHATGTYAQPYWIQETGYWLVDGNYADEGQAEDNDGSTFDLSDFYFNSDGIHYFNAVVYSGYCGPDTSDTLVVYSYCYPAACEIEASQSGDTFNFYCADCCNTISEMWHYGDGTQDATGTHIYGTPGNYTVQLNTIGLGGCNAGGSYDVELAAGIPTIQKDSYQLSPSPASTQINIQAAKPLASVRLYDVAGRLVREQTFNAGHNQSVAVPVQDVPSGMYQLQVRFADGAASSRKVEISH